MNNSLDTPVVGVEAVVPLQQPQPVIRLIDFEDFRALDEFPRFPENQNLACPLADIDIDNSFIVFISHCWLRGWPGAEGYSGRPHPDNSNHEKFSLCLSGIEKMIENFAFNLEKCYVWLDFGCINQNSDPAGELKQLDEIVRCCDCIFTPIVDAGQWDLVHTQEGFFSDYKAEAWNHDVHGYLNRGWCRLEMFYAANIPVRPSLKIDLFTAGLRFATAAGRRPHVLYGSREERNDSQPIVLDPLLNLCFEKYHPMKGNLSVKDDMHKIESLVEVLRPYMTTSRDTYIGDRDSDGRRHGQGTLTFDDGNKYSGQFRQDQLCGLGEYVFANGDRYDGDFRDDTRCGYGVFSFANGNTYAGDFQSGRYCGFGTYTFANGDVYSGEWRDGRKHGYGVFSCVNGFNYDGEWRDDKRHGFAAFTSSNGDGYIGDFRDNVEAGFGVYRYSCGDIYEGQFSGGKKHGYGLSAFSDGDKYEGDFYDGEVQGQGRFRYFNEDTYEGATVNGCYEGFGTYVYADGRRYVGQYRGNLKHGKGVFFFGPSGDKGQHEEGREQGRFEGSFVDDMCCGVGKVFVDGEEHAVTLDSVDVLTVIEKYQPTNLGIDGKSTMCVSPEASDSTRMMSVGVVGTSTRSLHETDKGLRYYCSSIISNDPASKAQFWSGENRWCASNSECTCTAVCGPLSGCQCQHCYQLTFPSECLSAPVHTHVTPTPVPAEVEMSAVIDTEAVITDPLSTTTETTADNATSDVDSGGPPVFASKWGRVRMAITRPLFGFNNNDDDNQDCLPPAPSLLSTRSSRMPSSGNIPGPMAPRLSITKIHVEASPSPGDGRAVEVAPPDDITIDFDDDDLDGPPPMPPMLMATKSRSTYSTGGGDSTSPPVVIPVVTPVSRWKKVKDIVSFVGKASPPVIAKAVEGKGSNRSNRRASSTCFAVGIGYEGSQSDGLFDGPGVLVYKGGAVYRGLYTEGRRCDPDGSFTYSLVSSYRGAYVNDLRSGVGRMEFPNASCYSGGFANGVRDGQGVFTYVDGGSFVGSFKDGLYDGYGVHTLPNGCKYEGNYKNGWREGRGVFTFRNGELSFEGDFCAGVLVSGTISTSKGLQRIVSGAESCTSTEHTSVLPTTTTTTSTTTDNPDVLILP